MKSRTVDWSKGLSMECYVTVVEPTTWHDMERIEITGGSISRSNEGMRTAADINFVDYDQSAERWIRVYMDVNQDNGGAEHVPLFTGLATSPDKTINGTLITNRVKCDSVLLPASDMLLPRGWYAPATSRTDNTLKNLLSVTPAPLEIADGIPALKDHIVSEENESNLTMVDKILTAIGWRMQIQGDGTISILPEPDSASAMFDPIDYPCIETELTVEYAWFSAPNVFRAVVNDEAVTVKDTDPDSRLSTVSRGREIWKEERNCNLNVGESLRGYAQRRLKEEQSVLYKVNYNRRFDPDVLITDLVTLNYPEQQIQQTFKVWSQSITLGSASISEEVRAI